MHNTSSADARKAGNFSRRHHTSEAYDTAREKYGTRRERQARRQEGATQRQLLAETRSPQAQLDLLDARLGEGLGATKERARLKKIIGAQPKPKRQRKGQAA